MTLVASVLLALAALGALTALASIWALARRFAPGDARLAPVPVTLLRPLHGAEPGLDERLAALVAQQYDAPVQLVFGVHAPDDSAVAVVERLRAGHPQADITLVVDGARHGRNNKVSNLINMAAAARHDVVVVTDSDVLVRADWLGQVVGELQRPGVGVVTALYTGDAARPGPWARLAAMAVSYQFLPGVALAVELGLAHPCMGSTVALTRGTLARIGGFEAVADALADDYEIGVAVRALGLKIAMPPLTVVHAHSERRFRALWRQEIRWARTIRTVDAGGHFAQLVTYFLPLAVIGAVLAGGTPVSLAVLVGALGVRGLQKYRIDAATATDSGPLWLLPLRDFLSLGVWAGSYFVRSVDWRGARHRLSSGGDMLD